MSETYFATCKLGLESIVAGELKELGAREIKSADGRVYFSGEADILPRACLWLRTAERAFLRVEEFRADSFDALFEGVKSIEWERFLPKDAAIIVKGKSARSTLHSVSDVQSITKKAIIERLKTRYRINWFPETGNQYIIETGLLDDVATIALEASGAGLSRRGYRTVSGDAPLAETLAAALLLLSRFDCKRPFYDPMCGSGTIAVEAAMMAKNRAPGLGRPFAGEQWQFVEKSVWENARAQANAAIKPYDDYRVFASDIDENMLKLAQMNAAHAGVSIITECADIRDFCAKESDAGLAAMNPPYGERLLDKKQAQALYREMGKALLPSGQRLGIFTADPQFERFFGKRADKRRKLTNGGIVCQYYQYFK